MLKSHCMVQVRIVVNQRIPAKVLMINSSPQLYEIEVSLREVNKKESELVRSENERLKELLAEKEEEVLEMKKFIEQEKNRRLEAEKCLQDMQNDIKVPRFPPRRLVLFSGDENAVVLKDGSSISYRILELSNKKLRLSKKKTPR